jgi:hypothetical protein
MTSITGNKQPGQEVDQSPPSCAQVKNVWNYTSAPLVCLFGVERENFTLTFAAQHPRRHVSADKKKFLIETKFLLSCCIDF